MNLTDLLLKLRDYTGMEPERLPESMTGENEYRLVYRSPNGMVLFSLYVSKHAKRGWYVGSMSTHISLEEIIQATK